MDRDSGKEHVGSPGWIDGQGLWERACGEPWVDRWTGTLGKSMWGALGG